MTASWVRWCQTSPWQLPPWLRWVWMTSTSRHMVTLSLTLAMGPTTRGHVPCISDPGARPGTRASIPWPVTIPARRKISVVAHRTIILCNHGNQLGDVHVLEGWIEPAPCIVCFVWSESWMLTEVCFIIRLAVSWCKFTFWWLGAKLLMH